MSEEAMGGIKESPLWNNLDAKITALKMAVNEFPLQDQRRAVDKVETVLLAFIAQIKQRESVKMTENLPSAAQLMSQNWTDHTKLNSQPDTNTESSVVEDSDNASAPCTKKIRGRPKLGKVHMCHQCSRVFKRPCLLKQHVSSAHMGAPRKTLRIQCEHCGRLFRTSIGLNAHRKRYHEVEREVYRCPNCTFASFSQSSFDKHMSKFHGPDRKSNSVCDVCGKGFVTRHSLKMHREVHSTEKKYHCEQCSYATNTLSGLRSHSYTQHNPGVRLFQCHVCNKQWKKKALYISHMEKLHRIEITVNKKPGPKSVCESTLPKQVEHTMTSLTAVPVGLPYANVHQPPSYSTESRKNIPIPVMCVQTNSNDMNYMPQGYNTQTPKLDMDFNVDQTVENQKLTHDSGLPMMNPTMALPQNIHVGNVIDDLLKHMDV